MFSASGDASHIGHNVTFPEVKFKASAERFTGVTVTVTVTGNCV